jgi:2-amino-4-hydroxy-6-hydroxymethyldihydropteridine diphosphokinase
VTLKPGGADFALDPTSPNYAVEQIMARSLIAVGSNLGDRTATLDAAVSALAQADDVELLRQSAWQMTLPVGGRAGRNEFLNGAVLVETPLSPQALLAGLQEIEDRFGRERQERWGDRTLDLDLLLYDDAVIDTPSLTVPHPRMSFRPFALEPAVEIAPELVHPTIGWSLERLLAHLDAGADAVALVSQENSRRDAVAIELLRRYPLELSGPTIRDEARWPAQATTFLRVPDAPPTSGEPKLTIVLGQETPHVPGRGPTLGVPAADGQDMMTDVFAAVAAVWPRLGPAGGERLQ